MSVLTVLASRSAVHDISISYQLGLQPIQIKKTGAIQFWTSPKKSREDTPMSSPSP